MTKISIANTLKVVVLGGGLVAISACAPKIIPEDPCAAADRPIELNNLLENSLTGSYEACLAVVRNQAATALEK